MAREQNKPVLIDFSGHGCVNCRKWRRLYGLTRA